MRRLIAGFTLHRDGLQACPWQQRKVARCLEDAKPTSGGVDRHQNAVDPTLELRDKEAGTPISPSDGVRGVAQQDPHAVGVTLAPQYHQIGTMLVGVSANLDAGKTVSDAQLNLIDLRRPQYAGFEPPTQVFDLRIGSLNSGRAGSFGNPCEPGHRVHLRHAEDAALGRTPGG
jgi:hypothetical protein